MTDRVDRPTDRDEITIVLVDPARLIPGIWTRSRRDSRASAMMIYSEYV